MIQFQFIYKNLKSAERKAADFCLAYPDIIASCTISEAAEQAGCSEATLVRLSRRLGYGGYSELKSRILAEDLKDIVHHVGVSSSDSVPTIANKVFHSCILYLQDSLQAIDFDCFEKVLELLKKSKRLIFAASGDAHFVAASGAQKFMRLGYPVSASTDFDTQLLVLSQMNENDVLICISHSGRTRDVCDLAKIAHEQNVKVISITNFPVSPLSKVSDIVLLTASFAYDMMDEILAKRVPSLCLLDALYVCLLLQQDSEQKELAERSNQFLLKNKI